MQFSLLAVVAASRLADASASLDLKERPVAKVIGLLNEMQQELTKEGETDQELYDKLSCWCETNGGDKTAAIEEANRRIDGLTSDIERLTSTGASLTASIASLQDEIAKNKAALDQASTMRAEQLADFNAEEKDMISSIASLKGAVTALAKHQSFLQVGSPITSDLKHVFAKATPSLSSEQRSIVAAFIAGPANAGSYASQSGAIFGILEQMKETFETNMAQSQQDESEAAAQFADLKSAKTEEIRSATAMVDSQTQELANADEANASAKQNLKDTRAALSADTQFLADLKEKCRNADAEFEERSRTRNEEIKAISETIGILNSDESHDLMASTLAFVQKDTRRQRAQVALRTAARKSGSTALAAVAISAGLDAFEKVQAAINDMVSALKTEMADEVAHKNFCTQEFAENSEQLAVTQDAISDLTASIGDLESTIKTLTGELQSASSQVAEMKTQMKRAGEDREIANKEFQETVADQRAVQQILSKAHARLKQFYGDRALLQVRAHTAAHSKAKSEPGAEAPPAPEGFQEYKKNEKSGGVMGLIQGILDEAKQMENDALRAEHDSQTAYEEFIKDSNASITTLNKSITDKTERKAAASIQLLESQGDQTKALKNGDSLTAKKATLHTSCDFTLNNFDASQAARGAEISALGEAKAILSGAS